MSPTAAESSRERFWAHPPALPSGLALERQEALVVPQRGRTGELILDWATLHASGLVVPLLVLARNNLLARDIPPLKERLSRIIEDRKNRDAALGRTRGLPPLPALVTDSAIRSVAEACVREGIVLIDRTGTVLIHSSPVFIHVEGMAPVQRSLRRNLFTGKGGRIIRVLLSRPTQPLTAQALAVEAETSYVHAHGILATLEAEGYVLRESRRSGFRLGDPGRLLRSWIDSGDSTSVAIDPYNAPSTGQEDLSSLAQRLQARGIRSILTLASGLRPDEAFVSGLPHGLYLAGEVAPVIEALRLRRTTPHNFLILRAEAAAETDAGGIYHTPRMLPQGVAVALPQLAVDFVAVGARGHEQAMFLLERYLAGVPLRG